MNLNHYITAKAEIQEWYLRQRGRSGPECISIIASSTHVPAIVCAFFIGEISGWPEDVLDNIETLYKTYSYVGVVGIPESYPRRKV